MNRAARPTPSGNDLDNLLRSYFQSEMPNPWPASPGPCQNRVLPLERPRQKPLTRWASRGALAASVALLLLGAWLWPSARPGSSSREAPGVLRTIDEGSAGRGAPLPHGPGGKPGTLTPDKVKSSLHLEQGSDGRTGIKITIEELPSNR